MLLLLRCLLFRECLKNRRLRIRSRAFTGRDFAQNGQIMQGSQSYRSVFGYEYRFLLIENDKYHRMP